MKDLLLILVGILFQAAMLWAFCNIPYILFVNGLITNSFCYIPYKCIFLGYSIFALIQAFIEIYRKNKKQKI